MRVDVTPHLKEEARCVIDTEPGTRSRGPAHHGTLPHYATLVHHGQRRLGGGEGGAAG